MAGRAPTARRQPRRREFGFATLVADTLSIWFKRLPAFLIITVLVYLPLFAYQWWFIRDVREHHGELSQGAVQLRTAFTELLSHVSASIAAGAFSYVVFRALQRQKAGILDCVGLGLRRLPAILGVAVVVGLMIGLLGLPANLLVKDRRLVHFLLLLPQVWLQVALSTAVPAAVIERLGVGAALTRSMQLTQGYRWSIFLAWLLFIVVFMVVVIPIAMSMLRPGTEQLADPEAFESRVYLLVWIGVGLAAVVASMLAVAQCVAYHGLRANKESMTPDELLKAFE